MTLFLRSLDAVCGTARRACAPYLFDSCTFISVGHLMMNSTMHRACFANAVYIAVNADSTYKGRVYCQFARQVRKRL